VGANVLFEEGEGLEDFVALFAFVFGGDALVVDGGL